MAVRPGTGPESPVALPSAVHAAARRQLTDATGRKAAPSPRPRRLWLAIHCPLLPLEALEVDAPGDAPRAVFETRARIQRVVAADAAATRAGVGPGMRITEARLLTPGLRLLERRPGAERRLLNSLGHVLLSFSDTVVDTAEHTLAVEIAGSLRLFGGLDSLHARLGQALAGRVDARLAVAPNPTAATLGARAGIAAPILDPDRLRSVLGSLPIRLFEPGEAALRRLSGFGVTTLRDLFRLPRGGLSRRLGKDFVDRLERLLGECPDPYPPLRLERRFRHTVHLDEETRDAAILLREMDPVLEQLQHALERNGAGIRDTAWTLVTSGEQADVVIDIHLSRVGWRAETLRQLLSLRLEATALPRPVRGIRLDSGPFLPLPADSHSLFARLPTAQGHDFSGLLDRLGSRLGRDAVQGIGTVAEYRPEQAWRLTSPAQPMPPVQAGPRTRRPLWILRRPKRLRVDGDRPWLRGPLRLSAETERIRCGWWDGGGIDRDYRQAISCRGERLWVFRDGRGNWYLHGIY